MLDLSCVFHRSFRVQLLRPGPLNFIDFCFLKCHNLRKVYKLLKASMIFHLNKVQKCYSQISDSY